MIEQPQRSHIEFRYSLGDLCLFRVGFDAYTEDAAFDPEAAPLSLPLVSPRIPPNVDAYVYRERVIAQQVSTIHPTRYSLAYVRNQIRTHYIDLHGTFQNYLRGFSSKTRSTLQRKVRRIAAMAGGKLECRVYSSPETMEEFHWLARQVAVKTYQERLFGDAIPASQDFVDRICRLAGEDSVRGFILMVKEVPVAYLYLPASDRTLIYGYLGYDPAYGPLSPGTVLLYLALEKVFAEGRFRYFNFTHGEGQTKVVFGRASLLLADVYFFRWTLRNALVVYGHAMMDWLSAQVGFLLERLGLRRVTRRLLRRWRTGHETAI